MVASKLALILLSASAALVAADEPQLDIAAVAEAGAPPQPSIATNVAAQTVVYDSNKASAAAAASQSAQAADDADGSSKVKRAPCDPQQTGAGPVPSPDTASAFKSYIPFSASASAVPVPTGYNQAFRNLDGMNNALGYMGFTLMDSYDSNLCASKCNAIYGCNAFNIAFERSPSKDPSPSGGACEQPPTTTLIKCVFWGGPVTSGNAVNRGQWRNNYQVVIAGSNGYVNQSVDTIAGYDTPHYLQNNAISAPNDCNGASTYIGNQYWNDGKPFDTRRCSAACTAQTSANPSTPCRFFNTYIINKGNQPFGQYCAMYSAAYADGNATVSSVTYNSSTYTVSYSYSYTITPYTYTCTKAPTSLTCTNPGACGTYHVCPGNSNSDCICGTDVSNNRVCFRGSTPCSSQTCTSNSQCPTGSICLNSNSCCGTSVCAVWNTCTNTQSKRWIFRRRDVATVGGSVKRQDDGSGDGAEEEDVWTAAHIPESMQSDPSSSDDGSS